MSYANGPRSGAPTRERGAESRNMNPGRGAGDPGHAARRGERTESTIREPRGRPFSRSADWDRIGVFGAGVALGALLGAGAALLLAPMSGARTRHRLSRGVTRARLRAADAWDDLGESLGTRREAWKRGRARGRR